MHKCLYYHEIKSKAKNTNKDPMTSISFRLGLERDNLDEAFVVAIVDKDGGRLVGAVAISRAREDGDQHARVMEPISIHFEFVSTNYVRQVVRLQELAQRLLGKVKSGRAAQIVNVTSVG